MEKMSMIKEVKDTGPWIYKIEGLDCDQINGAFNEQELQEISQSELRSEKVFKKKGDKLYVKWKWYDNPFNSRIKVNMVQKYVNISVLKTFEKKVGLSSLK